MSTSLPLSCTSMMCGGRLPLSHLIQRMAALGETSAVIALCNLPLSLQAPVSWLVFGGTLTLAERVAAPACGAVSTHPPLIGHGQAINRGAA